MRAPDGHGVPTDDVAEVADTGADAATTDDASTADADPADKATDDATTDKPLTEDEQAAKDAADKEAADAKAKADAEFNPHGAPEGDYEYQLPEGVELDKSMAEAFAPLAKELDLSNAGAQKLVEMYIEKVQPSMAEAFVKGIEADVENQKAQFAADTKTLIAEDAKAADPKDRVFDGNNQKAVEATSARALDRFGSPELREFLDVSGLGNHPELMKTFYKIGKLVGEDNDFQRGGQVPQQKTREQKYYG